MVANPFPQSAFSKRSSSAFISARSSLNHSNHSLWSIKHFLVLFLLARAANFLLWFSIQNAVKFNFTNYWHVTPCDRTPKCGLVAFNYLLTVGIRPANTSSLRWRQAQVVVLFTRRPSFKAKQVLPSTMGTSFQNKKVNFSSTASWVLHYCGWKLCGKYHFGREGCWKERERKGKGRTIQHHRF